MTQAPSMTHSQQGGHVGVEAVTTSAALSYTFYSFGRLNYCAGEAETNAMPAYDNLTQHSVEVFEHLHRPLLRASSSLSHDTAARRFFTLSRPSNNRRCSLLARDCAAHLVEASLMWSISPFTNPHTWIKFTRKDVLPSGCTEAIPY